VGRRGRIIGVPTYAAFLRAINLGPTRQFPKASIKEATESAGGVDVETYINTGNVRLTTGMRSRARVADALERAYASDRGFAVPTVVFTLSELVQIAADALEISGDLAEEIGAEAMADRRHYVSLLKDEPTEDRSAAIEALSSATDLAVVRGRAVHLLLSTAYHSTPLGNVQVEKLVGVATNRNATVIRTLAERWGS
jgi:uncharacterized protein (DUF1697 family)